ncbi:MAG: TolC family outer membrane protein [Micavibrio aeruginosavorus]|nr:TolC family outer membrane protein [Micavibrio aeruginosavorus]
MTARAADEAAMPSAATIQNIDPAAGASMAAPVAASTVPAANGAGGLPGKVTIAEAVGFGVSTNPEYTRNADNRRATDEELRQAKGLYLPSIDFSADLGGEYSDNTATRNDGDGDDEETMFRRQAGLTLTQLLFDGFETKYENKRQQARVLSASHRVREATELVGLSIVESYLDVLRQRELLRISRQNVADHITIMEQIQDSATAGRSTEADMEQAKARLASARANEASVREALRVAEASFIRDVGDQPQDLVMPMVPVDALSANVEDQVKVALHQSPTLDIFEADIQVAHNEFEGSKSVFYPQVDFQLNARTGEDLGGVEGKDTSASALAVVNWNLYRGGIDTARVREQINREAQAKEERAKTAREIENEVRTTWARMVSAGERAREFATQAAANQETVKAYKDQFDLNRRTLLDVLDSQNELFVSQSNMVNAEFVEMFAVYRLLALKGELLPTLGVAYPREADPAKM